MDPKDKAALGAIAAASTAAASLGSVTVATFTSTAPAWGPLAWLGLTTTVVTTVALPVAGVVLVAGAATWGGYRVYKAMSGPGGDKMLPKITGSKKCSATDGYLIAANHSKRVKVGVHQAIIVYNSWVETATGEHHLVALDFGSDPSVAVGDASTECSQRITALFPEFTK